MIKLAYCNIEDLDLKKAYGLVCKNRQEKIDFYRFDKDKKLSCGAYLLLKKLLSEQNITNPEFETGKYGKAYISNHENIYFNLSHSGKIVLCAISDMEVGADVEYIDREIEFRKQSCGIFQILGFERKLHEIYRPWNESGTG